MGVVGVGHAGAMRMGDNAWPSLPTGQEAAVIVKGRKGRYAQDNIRTLAPKDKIRPVNRFL